MRGDVYRLKAPRGAMGHEQNGPRYAVVVQSDDLFASTLVVVPTSTSARSADHRPEIVVRGERTQALAEQVMAVDPARLGGPVGALSWGDLELVDAAVKLVLRLD